MSNVKVLASGTVLTTNAALATAGTIAAAGGLTAGSCFDGATLLNSEVCLDCTVSTTVFTADKPVTTTGAN